MKRVKVDGMIAEIGLYSVMFLSLLKESIFIVISFYLNNHRIVLKVIFFNLEHSGYFYPQLMNNTINDYVCKSRTIETLLPLSCACHDGCRDFCFMQQTFSVSHSHKSNDESRVCYRVLCKKPLKTAIMQGMETANLIHVIHPTKYKQNDDLAICSRSKNNKIIIDSFNINL